MALLQGCDAGCHAPFVRLQSVIIEQPRRTEQKRQQGRYHETGDGTVEQTRNTHSLLDTAVPRHALNRSTIILCRRSADTYRHRVEPMEHNINAAPNRPSHGDPDQANLEAYGDWVTVAPEPAPVAESAPVTDAADNGGAHQEPDSRAAQDLTAAEEELLDQLAESERVAAAPAVAAPAPGAGDPHATGAALEKLERQLTSLNADLKAVGQQLADLRSRGGAVPGATAAPADAAPPAAPTFDAEAAKTISSRHHAGGVGERCRPALGGRRLRPRRLPAGDAAEVAPEAQAHAPPPGGQRDRRGGRSWRATSNSWPNRNGSMSMSRLPLTAVATLPTENPIPDAPAPADGAETRGPGDARRCAPCSPTSTSCSMRCRRKRSGSSLSRSTSLPTRSCSGNSASMTSGAAGCRLRTAPARYCSGRQ